MSKNWYAIYTRSRQENKVFKQLSGKNIEAYLPLLKTLKIWSDRKKWVDEPLFKSYLFVNICKEEYLSVLESDGVVRYVTFEGKAVPIPEQQIEAIKLFIAQNTEPEKLPMSGEFSVNDRVNIIGGPMEGLSGTIVNKSGKNSVKIEIEVVAQSVYVSIPASLLKII